MRRREFLHVSAFIAWPLAGLAQQPAMALVGFVHGGSASSNSHLVDAFRRGLAESGRVEGLNVRIEYGWAEGQYDRLAQLVADLVRRPASVIFAGAPPAARAARAATPTIPVVFVSGDDPISSGLVESLNRPGGNVTGISLFSGSQLGAKHIELLHQLLPAANAIALLLNPTNVTQTEAQTKLTEEAARRIGLQLHVVSASTESELSQAFTHLVERRVDALVVGGDPFFTSQRNRLIELAARHALPVLYNLRAFVESGGLISYGSSINEAYRQAGAYVGRSLAGEKPSELPVALPTKFELVINLKTARALGLKVPPIVLARADEVIE
jgi:putative ABC transport system substrate-binding protein